MKQCKNQCQLAMTGLSRVNDNRAYFELLLHGRPIQRKALLETASDAQLDFLSELCYNILNTLPVRKGAREAMGRRKYMHEVANIKRSHAYRRQRVRKFKNKLLEAIDKVGKELKQVLGNTFAGWPRSEEDQKQASGSF